MGNSKIIWSKSRILVEQGLQDEAPEAQYHRAVRPLPKQIAISQ
jgi:hypothetical protein